MQKLAFDANKNRFITNSAEIENNDYSFFAHIITRRIAFRLSSMQLMTMHAESFTMSLEEDILSALKLIRLIQLLIYVSMFEKFA